MVVVWWRLLPWCAVSCDREYLPPTLRRGKENARVSARACTRTSWYFVCMVCTRPVCNDLRTSTRVRFINAFRVGLDRQCNEKFLNDIRSNATLLAFVYLFILHYANCILSWIANLRMYHLVNFIISKMQRVYDILKIHLRNVEIRNMKYIIIINNDLKLYNNRTFFKCI